MCGGPGDANARLIYQRAGDGGGDSRTRRARRRRYLLAVLANDDRFSNKWNTIQENECLSEQFRMLT